MGDLVGDSSIFACEVLLIFHILIRFNKPGNALDFFLRSTHFLELNFKIAFHGLDSV